MKIISSTLQFSSTHMQQQSFKQTLQKNTIPANKVNDTTNISNTGKALNTKGMSDIENGLKAAENDPTLNLIRAMIFMLTGKEIKTIDTQSLSDGTSVNLDTNSTTSTDNTTQVMESSTSQNEVQSTQVSYNESEQTTFNASGNIHTADNKIINFNISLEMSYAYSLNLTTTSQESSTPRQTKDPLVLNFKGTAASLSNQRFNFDLNTDGSTENINLLSSGNGFLAIDKNGDGKINNGSELFGATSGNGFQELSSLDSNSDGWIDENDKDYSKLLVWYKDDTGKDQLSPLLKEDVGAISLYNINTPFSLKNINNELLGNTKTSSVFLKESGSVGIIQQIDLTV